MKATTIYFEFESRDETPRIAAPEEYGELLGAGTLMDDRDAVDVVIDYPLDIPTTLRIAKPITVERFARGVADAYRVIYANDGPDGPYGIAGHGIDELYLESASRRSNGMWHLMIGS